MVEHLIRIGCTSVFVGGIAGMVISSVNGNNNAWVLSCGGATALAAVVLLAVSAVTRTERLDVFEDADAERLEMHVQNLVSAGADEGGLRDLVREALRVRRRTS